MISSAEWPDPRAAYRMGWINVTDIFWPNLSSRFGSPATSRAETGQSRPAQEHPWRRVHDGACPPRRRAPEFPRSTPTDNAN
jgi:hypothetical protein